MKLPVQPKDDRDIIDANMGWVAFANNTEDRDYIVQAINSYEKLVLAIRETIHWDNNRSADMRITVRQLLDEALKEAEKA